MTRVETAYRALKAALLAASELEGSVLPGPRRNAALIEAFDSKGGIAGRVFLNVQDEDAQGIQEEAGGGDPSVEFWQRARIEWVIERKDEDERETLFDTGLEEIAAALLADRTLGGACDDVAIDPPARSNIALAGAPRIKACSLPVRMLLTAPTYIG